MNECSQSWKGFTGMRTTVRVGLLAVLMACICAGEAAWAQSVPSWAIGSFFGHGGSNRVDVEVTIPFNGDVTMRTWDRGKELRSNGRYRAGMLVFERESYYLQSRGSGIRIVRASDRRDHVDLSRGFRPGGLSDYGRYGTVPSWAVGTFTGYTSRYRQDVELTVNHSGQVSMRTWDGSRQRRSDGRYRNGTIIFDKASYSIAQRGSGVRITLAGDRFNSIDLKRGNFGGGLGSYDSVPSWAVGTFTGYASRYRQQVELTISSSGRVTMRTWSRDRQLSSDGRYSRGKLVFDRESYLLERNGSGLRISLVRNPYDRIDLRPGHYRAGR